MPELEKARQSKLVGKSLDAKVWVAVEQEPLEISHQFLELRELLNVSQMRVRSDAKGIEIKVEKALGQKCERCWHWETDIGQSAEHPTLCGRCVEAVKPFKA